MTDPCPDVKVSIAAGFPEEGPKTGRVLLEVPEPVRMLTVDEARAVAGRLERAIARLDGILRAA